MKNTTDIPPKETSPIPGTVGGSEFGGMICSTVSITASANDGYWRKDGQQTILKTIRYKKRMTTAQAVAVIGKHGASALLALEKSGRVRRIKRGLYAEV